MDSRRDFLKIAALGTAALSIGRTATANAEIKTLEPNPPALPAPITNEERWSRIERAQALMQAQSMAGIVLEAGTSMRYFTGLTWRQSSRLTAVIIPAKGAPIIITPAFEESKLRELMVMEMDIRTWHEHESPYRLIGKFLDDRSAQGSIGIESTVRFFVANGLKRDVPSHAHVSAAPVVNALRQIKTPREIELMQSANDITMAAYREVFSQIETGMTGSDIAKIMIAAMAARGAQPVFTLALIGEASSYPHGSKKIHRVDEGQVILMDCGCDVHGYKSDISRTWVHGQANAKQSHVWETVRKGQDIVMEIAKPGVPMGDIDDAVRTYYESEGWGPDYDLPGLSHRTGHGIGMDVHEEVFVVRGNQTRLAPGMCYSNEPGIYIPGEFGVRHEDCVYMTEDGPKLFSGLSPSIKDPMS